MILVNIRRSGEATVTPEQIREAAAGDWVATRETLERYGDVLLAVRRNRVLGAYDVTGWEQVDEKRVRFELTHSAEFAAWVGQESPWPWRRGQANPVVYVDTPDPGLPAAADDAGKPPTGKVEKKPRRGVHRLVIETKGLSDADAAKLHSALLTTAKMTGHLDGYRSTSLVREMRQAAEELALDYVSARSPRKQRD